MEFPTAQGCQTSTSHKRTLAKKISELALLSLELIFIFQLREWARGELFCLLGPEMKEKAQDVFAVLEYPLLTWLEAAAGKPRESLVFAELGVSCSKHQQAPVYLGNQAVIASTHCRQHGRGTGAACRVTGSQLTPLFGDAP